MIRGEKVRLRTVRSSDLDALYGFLCDLSTRKLNRLQLTTMLGNVASQRVAEKCGFPKQGIARGAVFHRGENLAVQMYSLLRAEALGARLGRADEARCARGSGASAAADSEFG
jgi:hypothetical protein